MLFLRTWVLAGAFLLTSFSSWANDTCEKKLAKSSFSRIFVQGKPIQIRTTEPIEIKLGLKTDRVSGLYEGLSENESTIFIRLAGGFEAKVPVDKIAFGSINTSTRVEDLVYDFLSEVKLKSKYFLFATHSNRTIVGEVENLSEFDRHDHAVRVRLFDGDTTIIPYRNIAFNSLRIVESPLREVAKLQTISQINQPIEVRFKKAFPLNGNFQTNLEGIFVGLNEDQSKIGIQEIGRDVVWISLDEITFGSVSVPRSPDDLKSKFFRLSKENKVYVSFTTYSGDYVVGAVTQFNVHLDAGHVLDLGVEIQFPYQASGKYSYRVIDMRSIKIVDNPIQNFIKNR